MISIGFGPAGPRSIAAGRKVATVLLAATVPVGMTVGCSPSGRAVAAGDEPRVVLELGAPIGGGAVVQRAARVPVRGTAAPGAEVTVRLAGRMASGRADASGRFRVDLPSLPVGGPYEMTVESGGESATVGDLLVGDVWLCSGQSNMEWTVAHSQDAAREIAAGRDPEVRHFKVPRSWSSAPAATLAGGRWEAASPDTVGDFTAVGWFFARELRRHHDVPVGLIDSTWGGSRIEPWMSAGSLGLDAEAVAELLADERELQRRVVERVEARTASLPDPGGGGGDEAAWAAPDLDDAAWPTIAVPAAWEQAGWEGMDGVVWYRTELELDAAEAAAGVRLGLGKIDDSDIAWVNGHEIGRTERAWNRPRRYEVPPAALVAGRNVVAVRVEDTGGGGGIWGEPGLLFVEAGGEGGSRRPLAGVWRFRPATVTLDLDEHKNQVPTMLYNRMLHPLHDFPLRGVLWYQGESNAGADDAFVYRDLFRALIEDWRSGWGRPELPFLFVQLAGYMPPPTAPQESSWALLRESQAAALALPATAQVVTLDVGDADDVHPRDKQTVGRRLALAARRVVYGEEVVHSGPVYRGHEIVDGRVVIDFDHLGGGLVARGDDPRRPGGFAVAGDDRRFVWAEAVIVDGRVVVSSDEVPSPAAVRYGWADNPEGANLYNAEGLPAAPFRTDAWPPR